MRSWISFNSLVSFAAFCSLILMANSAAIAQTCPENLQTYPAYGQQEMVLEWTLPPTGTNAAEFDIYRGEILIGTVDSSTTAFVDDVSSLEANRHHVLY